MRWCVSGLVSWATCDLLFLDLRFFVMDLMKPVIKDLTISGKTVTGIEIPLHNATLVLIVAKKGFIMCGYHRNSE